MIGQVEASIQQPSAGESAETIFLLQVLSSVRKKHPCDLRESCFAHHMPTL